MEEDKLYCPYCGSTHLTANKKGFGAGKALTGAILTGGIGLLAGFIGSGKVKVTCLKCGRKMNAGELTSTPLYPKSVYIPPKPKSISTTRELRTENNLKQKKKNRIAIKIFAVFFLLLSFILIIIHIASNSYPLVTNRGDFDKLSKFENKLLADRAANNREGTWFLGSVHFGMTKQEVLDNVLKSEISQEIFFDSYTHSQIELNKIKYDVSIKYLFDDSLLLKKILIKFPLDIPIDSIINYYGEKHIKATFSSDYQIQYSLYYWIFNDFSIEFNCEESPIIRRELSIEDVTNTNSNNFDDYFSHSTHFVDLERSIFQIYNPILSYIEKVNTNTQSTKNEDLDFILQELELGMSEQKAKNLLTESSNVGLENSRYLYVYFNEKDSISCSIDLDYNEGRLSKIELHGSGNGRDRFWNYHIAQYGKPTFIKEFGEFGELWWIKDEITIIATNKYSYQYILNSEIINTELAKPERICIIRHNNNDKVLYYNNDVIETKSSNSYTSPNGGKQQQYQGSQEQKRDLDAIDDYARKHPGF